MRSINCIGCCVQRDDLDNVRSTSRILDPLQLSSASPDTLTPLQSIWVIRWERKDFLLKRVNLIVNDTGSFYMLNAIILLMGFKGKICVIPSTNVSSIPLLCNILMGWGMDFAVLFFENDSEIQMAELLKNSVFNTGSSTREMIIRMPGCFFKFRRSFYQHLILKIFFWKQEKGLLYLIQFI